MLHFISPRALDTFCATSNHDTSWRQPRSIKMKYRTFGCHVTSMLRQLIWTDVLSAADWWWFLHGSSLLQGPEPVAATHPGSSVPPVARQSTLGAGAAPSSPDLSATNQQAGGALEGVSWKCLPQTILFIKCLSVFSWHQCMMPINSVFFFMYRSRAFCLEKTGEPDTQACCFRLFTNDTARWHCYSYIYCCEHL